MVRLFESQILAFLVVVRQNKWHFLNHEIELEKIGILRMEILNFESWPNFTLLDLTMTFPRVEIKMNATVTFFVPIGP